LARGPRVDSPSVDTTTHRGLGNSIIHDRIGFPTDMGSIDQVRAGASGESGGSSASRDRGDRKKSVSSVPGEVRRP